MDQFQLADEHDQGLSPNYLDHGEGARLRARVRETDNPALDLCILRRRTFLRPQEHTRGSEPDLIADARGVASCVPQTDRHYPHVDDRRQRVGNKLRDRFAKSSTTNAVGWPSEADGSDSARSNIRGDWRGVQEKAPRSPTGPWQSGRDGGANLGIKREKCTAQESCKKWQALCRVQQCWTRSGSGNHALATSDAAQASTATTPAE